MYAQSIIIPVPHSSRPLEPGERGIPISSLPLDFRSNSLGSTLLYLTICYVCKVSCGMQLNKLFLLIHWFKFLGGLRLFGHLALCPVTTCNSSWSDLEHCPWGSLCKSICTNANKWILSKLYTLLHEPLDSSHSYFFHMRKVVIFKIKSFQA